MYHTHKGQHMAARPARREHFIYSQSENANEAGCFLISVGVAPHQLGDSSSSSMSWCCLQVTGLAFVH